LQYRLFKQYGTTLRGLQIEREVDMHDYLDYVHYVDLSEYMQPDPALRTALESLPQPKWIYTNASVAHAENVLNLMNLRDLFVDIIDVVATAPYCKPEVGSYEIALNLVGNPRPENCLFIDDRSNNLDTARALGIHTLQVKPKPDSDHPSISHLIHLPDYLHQTKL
ncbi:MAG TPA: HAD-IA family hydrolase, partial [Anaerolineaceae bacterium]|nr:HAD-IA family hydrolase [Anaerolineaceae bacterium]